MASTTFASLAPLVQPYAVGCPAPAIYTAMRMAAKELCKDAGVWVEDLAAINVVALTSTYTLPAVSTDGSIHTILLVRYNGTVLGVSDRNTLLTRYPTYPDTAAAAVPTMYAMEEDRILWLYPVPLTSVTGGLKVQVTVVPKMTAIGLDTRVAEDYEEELVRGTLHRLLSMPNKPWTDMKLADFYGRRFRNDITNAKIRMTKGFVKHSTQVSFPKVT